MCTIYSNQSAPDALTRYVGSAAIVAAIKTAALAAPEREDQLDRHPRTLPDGAYSLPKPEHYARGFVASGDWIEAHGPIAPEPELIHPSNVSFLYQVGDVRGRYTLQNTREGLTAWADKVRRTSAAFDGKPKRARLPSKPRAGGSAAHVAAREMLTDGDALGALTLAQTTGAVYFGQPSNLYMNAESVELSGHGFTIGRNIRTGRFRVLHTRTGLAVDSRADFGRNEGFSAYSAALDWIETQTKEPAWIEKLVIAESSREDFSQTAALEAFLNPPQIDGTAPTSAPEASADAVTPESAPDAPTAAPIVPDLDRVRHLIERFYQNHLSGAPGCTVSVDALDAEASHLRGRADEFAEHAPGSAATYREVARQHEASAAAKRATNIRSEWNDAPRTDVPTSIPFGCTPSVYRAHCITARIAERLEGLSESSTRAGWDDRIAINRFRARGVIRIDARLVRGQERTQLAQDLRNRVAREMRARRNFPAPLPATSRTFGGPLPATSQALPVPTQSHAEEIAADVAEFENWESDAQSKRDLAAQLARGAEFPETGGSVRFSYPTSTASDSGRWYGLAGPDASAPGAFRFTWFDERGPVAHSGALTLEGACLDALQRGYVPIAADVDPVEVAPLTTQTEPEARPCTAIYSDGSFPITRARAAYLLRAARSRGPSNRPRRIGLHSFAIDGARLRVITGNEPAPLATQSVSRIVPPNAYATDTHERPCAAPGLTSYRARGVWGWIMIGARDHDDAMREARRSSESVTPQRLQVWNGAEYVDAYPVPVNSAVTGHWRISASERPEYAPANRTVHVLFSGNRERAIGKGGESAGECVGFYMSRQTYRAIPLDDLATPADYERHGPIQSAPSDFLWSESDRSAKAQRNGMVSIPGPVPTQSAIDLASLTAEQAEALSPEQARDLVGPWWFGNEGTERMNTAQGRRQLHRVWLRYTCDAGKLTDTVLQSHALEEPRFNAHCWFARELSSRIPVDAVPGKPDSQSVGEPLRAEWSDFPIGGYHALTADGTVIPAEVAGNMPRRFKTAEAADAYARKLEARAARKAKCVRSPRAAPVPSDPVLDDDETTPATLDGLEVSDFGTLDDVPEFAPPPGESKDIRTAERALDIARNLESKVNSAAPDAATRARLLDSEARRVSESSDAPGMENARAVYRTVSTMLALKACTLREAIPATVPRIGPAIRVPRFDPRARIPARFAPTYALRG